MIKCAECGHENSDGSAFCGQCRKPLLIENDAFSVDTPRLGEEKPFAGGGAGELTPGELFAERYTIIAKVGQGGMGTVYRAREKLGASEREVALKLIRSDQLVDRQAIDRLMNEGVLTQDIRHDNVVAVYNVGETKQAPFVAMEFVNGISLRNWIRRQQYAQRDTPPVTLVAAIMRSVLDGLEAAHAKGVIHRDLKPENVVLTAEPTAQSAPLKILDFGIASGPGKTQVSTGTGMGTQPYMAPEQITNPDAAGPPADLYSLSRMFFEMLMGVLPQGFWQPPSGGRGDATEALDKLILDGLGTSPYSRPQSVADYRARLDAAIGSIPPPSPPPPEPPPPQPPEIDPKIDPLYNPPDTPKAVGLLGTTPRKIGAGVGALFLLSALASQCDPDAGPYDGGYDNNGGYSSDDVFSEAGDTSNPVTRDATWSDYTGMWNGEEGSRFNLTVDANGYVSGSLVYNGENLNFGGTLANGSLTLGNESGGINIPVSFPGSWCDPVFTWFNPQTGSSATERFHVNHMPEEQVCPALYAD